MNSKERILNMTNKIKFNFIILVLTFIFWSCNESKIDFQDLILLFAELSDDNLDGESQSLNRNIAIDKI